MPHHVPAGKPAHPKRLPMRRGRQRSPETDCLSGGQRRRSRTPKPIDADLHGMDFLIDAHGTMRYTGSPNTAEEDIAMTEVIEIILSKNGPVRSKRPLETGAGG